MSEQKGNYASVNGLEMYYEVHGEGKPLLLLHGGLSTINGTFWWMLESLGKEHRLIAPEQQGHGHTADISRPMSFEAMAADTAALLGQLGIDKVDVLGYSSGGMVALALAVNHPELIDRLVLVSAIFNDKGYYPEISAGLKQMNADQLPPIMREEYERVAPRPQDWSKFIEKSVHQDTEFEGWTAEQMACIKAPTLVIVGDKDIVRTEHAVEMFRLLPDAQLAVLPATDHVAIIMPDNNRMLPLVLDFLAEEKSNDNG